MAYCRECCKTLILDAMPRQRRTPRTLDLFSSDKVAEKPVSQPEDSGGDKTPTRFVMPCDLPASLTLLDDTDLDTLLRAVRAEAQRRRPRPSTTAGKPLPVSEGATVEAWSRTEVQGAQTAARAFRRPAQADSGRGSKPASNPPSSRGSFAFHPSRWNASSAHPTVHETASYGAVKEGLNKSILR